MGFHLEGYHGNGRKDTEAKTRGITAADWLRGMIALAARENEYKMKQKGRT